MTDATAADYHTMIAWAALADDGTVYTGNIEQFADYLDQCTLAGEAHPATIYTSRAGKLVEISYQTKPAEIIDDIATVVVTVDLRNGQTLTTSCRTGLHA